MVYNIKEMINTYATYIYCFFNMVIILFHLALIAGAPWGEITMGGQDKGKLPIKKRLMAFIAIPLLIFFAFNILSQSEIVFTQWKYITDKTIWIVVGFNFLTALGNILTKSKWERIIWAPITVLMFICVLVVVV